jgi:uncharacterized membrane protein
VKRPSWDEIDVLRGLAALLMVCNHAGVAWYGEEPARSTVAGAVTYAGGFAPVLFFLVTGIGYGVAPVAQTGATHRFGLANKVAILIAADVLLAWRHGRWLGLDFLGFIALSMLALEELRARTAATARALALAGVVAVLVVRFGLGPILMSRLGGDAGAIAGWVTGARGIDGLAYPPCPWLVYPLAGFLIGRAVQRRGETVRTSVRVRVGLGLLVVATCGVAGALALAGRPSYRWGVMTIAFLVQSLAMIATSFLAVLLAEQRPRLSSWSSALRLRGVSSLAFVPLHYVALLVVGSLVTRPPSTAGYVLGVVLAGALTLWLAKRFAAGVGRAGDLDSFAVWIGLVVLVGISGASLRLRPEPADAVVLMAVGQLALCALLVVRRPKRMPAILGYR